MTAHTTTKVARIPDCDLCTGRPTPAWADARLVRGPSAGSWAWVCQKHFRAAGCELGLGRGQELILMS